MPDFGSEIDCIVIAQHLQMGIMEVEPVRRYIYAEDALLALAESVNTLQAASAKYYIDSDYAVNHPEQRYETEHRLGIFGKVAVEGRFRGFSYIQIGKIVSSKLLVDSLCLSLDDVSMLPDGETLSDGSVLHLPVLAITQRLRVA